MAKAVKHFRKTFFKDDSELIFPIEEEKASRI